MPRALGIINVQHRRHVWVHVPGSSAFLQRHQKIFSKLIWMFPEMQHRGFEVHVDDKAVVSKFERAVEQLQIHLSNKFATHACAWWLRNPGLVVRQTFFLVVLFTHSSQFGPSPAVSVIEDMLIPLSSSVAQYPGSLCKASVNELMNTASS